MPITIAEFTLFLAQYAVISDMSFGFRHDTEYVNFIKHIVTSLILLFNHITTALLAGLFPGTPERRGYYRSQLRFFYHYHCRPPEIWQFNFSGRL